MLTLSLRLSCLPFGRCALSQRQCPDGYLSLSEAECSLESLTWVLEKVGVAGECTFASCSHCLFLVGECMIVCFAAIGRSALQL